MATARPKKAPASKPPKAAAKDLKFCSQPQRRERSFAPDVNPRRAAAILTNETKWVNGTEITFAFMDGPASQKTAMRRAFDVWRNVGIGLSFREVPDPDDATVRIAFANDGSWSYVGRDVLTIDREEPTMNIGWDISSDLDTGVHEIGHTLGLNHEHQNPNAGIVWNEEAVYAALAAPPNNWDRNTTYHNIIRKLDPREVTGSSWDPNSVMHYPFRAGLIRSPHPYDQGLQPAGGLSPVDKAWVKQTYPPRTDSGLPTLLPHRMVPLRLVTGQQADFLIEPDVSELYDIATFGSTDSVMVLFEQDGDRMKYLCGDDDSGTRLNAHIQRKLSKGKRYVVRIRMLYARRNMRSHVMLW